MANVLVVSRNATLGVGLIHLGYDVTDVRPDRHGDWTREAEGTHAVVLELSDAVAAESAVLRLRHEGLGVPVLVVSNSTPGWDTAAAHLGGGTSVLALPISLPKLQAELDNLIAAGPVDTTPLPKDETEMLHAVAASVGLAITENGTVVPEGSVATQAPPEVMAEPEPEPEPEPVARPALPEPSPLPAPPPAAAAGEGRHPASDLYVATLLDWARDLTGVAECAEVIALELADRVGAEAAALLLPDGDEWRVAGGAGLRPLEHRARLTEEHWLVANVVITGKGMLADDTDAARDVLTGAPLASWPRVIAVPVREVRGLFLAARGGAAFTEESLQQAVALAAEAMPLLKDALAVRTLARALAPYAEFDDA